MTINPLENLRGPDVSHCRNASEAFDLALLNRWNVRLARLEAYDEEFDDSMFYIFETEMRANSIPVEDYFATVFDSPFSEKVEVLGVVGRRYRPVQNEKLHELLDTACSLADANFHRAGWLSRKKRVYASLQLRKKEYVGGIDQMKFFLVVATSHDGSFTFRFELKALRAASGTLESVLGPTTALQYRAKHTANARSRIDELREFLSDLSQMISDYLENANKLFRSPITESEAQEIAMILMGAKGASSPQRVAKIEEMGGEYLMVLRRNLNDELNLSRWIAYQSFVEWFQFYANIQVKGESESYIRASRTVFPSASETKAYAKALRSFSGN